MPKPLKFVRPDEVLEFTMRTDQGRALLRPIPEVVACILGVLARCLTLYPVDLYAFVFMSNHAHLLARVRNACAAASFIGYLKRNTALAIKRCTGYRGGVWDTPGEPVPVLDDLAAIRRVRYHLSNGVKEGLVASPLEWPGPTSARALVSDMRIVAPPHKPRPRNGDARTLRRWAQTEGEPQVIELKPLPCFDGKTREQLRTLHAGLISDVIAEANAARQGAEPLGVARVLEIDPFAPIDLEETPPPRAHYTMPGLYEEYLAERAAFERGARAAARVHRSTPVTPRFPMGAYVPALGFQDD